MTETIESKFEQVKKNAHDMYNGGNHEKKTQEIFHHGMTTGFNVAENFFWDALIGQKIKTWKDKIVIPIQWIGIGIILGSGLQKLWDKLV